MKITEKINLKKNILKELERRNYSFNDLSMFFGHFNILLQGNIMDFQQYFDDFLDNTLTKMEIADVPFDGELNTETILIDMAKELDVYYPTISQLSDPPELWENENGFRLFVSHLAKDKLVATRMKETLDEHKINAFVAHMDIVPTREWEEEIEKGLKNMDALLSIHTEGFSNSFYCQQEIGWALGRGIKIINLMFSFDSNNIKIKEEPPKGFVQKSQALLGKGKNAVGLAKEIKQILLDDDRTRDKLNEVQEEDVFNDIPF